MLELTGAADCALSRSAAAVSVAGTYRSLVGGTASCAPPLNARSLDGQAMSALEDLRREFQAEESSFLLQLRGEIRWDPVAFGRMTALMLEVVKSRNPEVPIPRWLAEGFWFLDWFVKDWSTHPNFPRPLAERYYRRAYERLHDLAYWLFMGKSPYENESGFEDLRPDE
jgi:hypothetical protein